MAIVDSPSGESDADKRAAEIKKSDVIVLIYAVDEPQSLERVSSYWFPLLESLECSVPVILVGNKVDVRDGPAGPSEQLMEKNVMPLMNKYKSIETCIECSAKSLSNVPEVFYFAQKAVLHPLFPLFDTELNQLKEKCVAALKRIFKLCDVDGDGILNDEETNLFQAKCFKTPLTEEEMASVKNVVGTSVSDGVVPVPGKQGETGLSVDGFVYLHKLFIQRGRPETTWTVLRTFGYQDDLSLDVSGLVSGASAPAKSAAQPTVKVVAPQGGSQAPQFAPDQHFEWTDDGRAFLNALFTSADKDGDDALNSDELRALFGQLDEFPWSDEAKLLGFVETTDDGALTRNGFHALWATWMLDDISKAAGAAILLGLPGDKVQQAIRPCKARAAEYQSKVTRKVLTIFVFGGEKSGKSTFARGLVGKYRPGFSPPEPVVSAAMVAERVKSDKEARRTLVVREMKDASVLNDDAQMAKCDLAVCVYDQSNADSFAVLPPIIEKLTAAARPVVVVRTKVDAAEAEQRYEESPFEFTQSHELPDPIDFTPGATGSLYSLLLNACLMPMTASPKLKAEREAVAAANKRNQLIVVAGAAALVAFGVYKVMANRS